MSIEYNLEKKENGSDPGRKIKKIYYFLGIVGIILSIITIIFCSKYYVMIGGDF